jgi:hypothetical protein
MFIFLTERIILLRMIFGFIQGGHVILRRVRA